MWSVTEVSGVWQHTPLISTQEAEAGSCLFKDSQGYTEKPVSKN